MNLAGSHGSGRARRLIARLRRWRSAHPTVTLAARILFAVLIVAGASWFFLVPQFAAASDDLAILTTIPVGVVVLGAGLEIVSLVSFSVMTRQVVGRTRVSFLRLLAIDLADLAVNHTLPGGGTTAAAVRYRLLRAQDVAAKTAIGVATIETAVSNLALSVLFGVGAVALTTRLDGAWYLVAGALAVAVVGTEALIGWALISRPDRSIRIAARIGRHVPFVGERRAGSMASELSRQLRDLIGSPRRALVCLGAAFANWVLDAAVLWLMIAGCGEVADPLVVLMAYTLATLVAQLPLTPGGLGLVESITTAALIGLGLGHAPALFGVIGWRLLEYLLPTPIGWAAYLILRLTPPKAMGPSAVPAPHAVG